MIVWPHKHWPLYYRRFGPLTWGYRYGDGPPQTITYTATLTAWPFAVSIVFTRVLG